MDTNKRIPIKQKGLVNTAIVNSEITINVSIYDEIARLNQNKDYEGIAQLMKQVYDMTGAVHPLSPWYRFKPIPFGSNFILTHEPLSREARDKYPLSYRGKFKVKNQGDKDLTTMIDKAFINQEKIEINMLSFQTWLGDNEVPTPNLDNAIKEGKWAILPDSLPKPLILKVSLMNETNGENITIWDYLELNICDIDRENNVYTLDNSRHAHSKLYINIKLGMDKSNVKLNISIKPDFIKDVDANYSLLNLLIKMAKNKGMLVFKNLQENADFIIANKFDFNEDIEKLTKELQLLKRLQTLEKYFDIKFYLPDRFDADDWEYIEILESIMEGNSIKMRLKNLKIDCTEKEALLDLIQVFELRNQEGVKLKVVSTGKEGRIELFGAVIPLEKIETKYNHLKLKNIDALKRKADSMEDGELIKATLVPGEDNNYTEKYYVKDHSK